VAVLTSDGEKEQVYETLKRTTLDLEMMIFRSGLCFVKKGNTTKVFPNLPAVAVLTSEGEKEKGEPPASCLAAAAWAALSCREAASPDSQRWAAAAGGAAEPAAQQSKHQCQQL
jgi:hypothetical protein